MKKANSLWFNARAGRKWKGWSKSETLTYLLKGLARELHLAPKSFYSLYLQQFRRALNRYRIQQPQGDYFNICGARLPDFSRDPNILKAFAGMWDDTFLIPRLFKDNYDKQLIEALDPFMDDGPYSYRDKAFDVTVHNGDIVIDAGAWIGDFSAYAAAKGATVYAFEPVANTFAWLEKTALLNSPRLPISPRPQSHNPEEPTGSIHPVQGSIHPVQMALSDHLGQARITLEPISGGNTVVMRHDSGAPTEPISLTTLDRFVEELGLERIDFIKADIEGSERDLLRGATRVLSEFAPRLALCTYHLPDDPELLSTLILQANPNYTIRHLRHKLFAAVL